MQAEGQAPKQSVESQKLTAVGVLSEDVPENDTTRHQLHPQTKDPASEVMNDNPDDSDDLFSAKRVIRKQLSVKEDVSHLLKVNMGYIVSYVLVVAFATWQCTWAIAGNSQTTDVFRAKFEWDEDQTKFYNTLISSLGSFGLAIGSFSGGFLIKFGRVKAGVIAQSIAIVSSAIAMGASVPTICVSRLLVGLSAGIQNVVFGKMINENMPANLASRFSMLHNISICTGFIPAFAMGAILPDPEDLEGLKVDENWRIIYCAPAIIAITYIVFTLVFFRLEPIAYCIITDREEQGKLHMARVYRKADPTSKDTIEDLLDAQFVFQRRSTTMDASSASFKTAACGRKYAKGTWVCFALNSFNQLTGINAVNTYANRLLVQMEEQGGGDFPLTPLEGTYVIGVSNAFFACIALFIITYFGRRPIFVIGQISMAVSLIFCGVAIQQGWNLTSFIMLCVFIACYQMSQGSVAWLYIPEVTVDSASGLAIAAQFINLLIIQLTFEYMIDSSLGVEGTMWYFGGWSLVGFIFCLIMVRETRGLTDLEKKTLYSPKDIGGNEEGLQLVGIGGKAEE